MIENKLKSYSRLHPDSVIFYRLREKMEVLKDNIELVKAKTQRQAVSDKQIDLKGEDELK
jgi:hypothetical protein